MYDLRPQQLYLGFGCYLATHEAVLLPLVSGRLLPKVCRVFTDKDGCGKTKAGKKINEQRLEKTQSPCVSPRTAQLDWRSLSPPLRLADSYIVQQEITIY